MRRRMTGMDAPIERFHRVLVTWRDMLRGGAAACRNRIVQASLRGAGKGKDAPSFARCEIQPSQAVSGALIGLRPHAEGSAQPVGFTHFLSKQVRKISSTTYPKQLSNSVSVL
jgi:hypothetical protein